MRSLVFLVLLAAMAGSKAAAGGPDCKAPISIGLGLSFDRDGYVASSLVKILAERTGCRFHVMEIPRLRLWKQLKAGELDMALLGLPTPERREFCWFVPYVTMRDLAVFRADSVHITDSASILDNDAIAVGVAQGVSYNPTIDALIGKIRARRPERIFSAADQPLLLKMLQSDRVQVAFMEEPVYLSARREGGVSSVASIDVAPHETPAPHSIVLSKARFSHAEAEKWRDVTARLLTDGSIGAMLHRNLTKEERGGLTVPARTELK
ncbi:MAG TPA: transporter substrate-binding domain-containing protein [Magnetospirillaceae bacterium]|nr:transporter substrate-binding domain-containing protein [Magnetospirillaceae bacterium]